MERGERERESLNFMLLSFLPSLLSLLPFATCCEGDSRGCNFHPSAVPSIHFAVFIGTAARGGERKEGDMLNLSGRLTRSLAALRQKTKRFPYQIPSSAFCAIRILGYYSNGLRARELLPGEGGRGGS